MHIIGLYGSNTRESNSERLVDTVLASANTEGADISSYSLKETLPSEGLGTLYDPILECDGFVIGTPVYWMGMSSHTKRFLEALTEFEENGFLLQGKAVGLVASCNEDGAWKTLLDLYGPLNHMGCIIPPVGMVWQNCSMPSGGENGWMYTDCELLGKNLVQLIKSTSEVNWNL